MAYLRNGVYWILMSLTILWIVFSYPSCPLFIFYYFLAATPLKTLENIAVKEKFVSVRDGFAELDVFYPFKLKKS